MTIVRHPVDLQRLATVFQWEREHLTESLQWAKETPEMLYSFLGVAAHVYIAGSILAPDAPDAAQALKLAAQAGTALFIFQRIDTPPPSFVLGEGPPVIYTKSAGS